MALVNVYGSGPLYPPPPNLALGSSMRDTGAYAIDATGEKVAFVGRFFHKSGRGTTKDIRKVGFRFAGVVKAGGSALTLSLQNVDAANGPVYRPDETQDQTYAIANADAAFVANGWYLTGNLSADRTIAFGELVAVVIEFDGAGRLGADQVLFSAWNRQTTAVLSPRQSGVLLKVGGSWTMGNQDTPNVLFECSDGSFGGLMDAAPASNHNIVTLTNATNPNEYAVEFTLPFACKVDGGWFACYAEDDTPFEVRLYDGTSVMTGGSVAIDPQQIEASGAYNYGPFSFADEVSLAAGTTYRLALAPTSANTAFAIPYFDVSSADHRDASYWGLGTNWAVTDRNGGAWAAPTTTRQFFAGLRISSLHDGAAVGGGSSYIIGG